MKDIFLILSEEEVQPRNSKAARNSANAQPGQYPKAIMFMSSTPTNAMNA